MVQSLSGLSSSIITGLRLAAQPPGPSTLLTCLREPWCTRPIAQQDTPPAPAAGSLYIALDTSTAGITGVTLTLQLSSGAIVGPGGKFSARAPSQLPRRRCVHLAGLITQEATSASVIILIQGIVHAREALLLITERLVPLGKRVQCCSTAGHTPASYVAAACVCKGDAPTTPCKTEASWLRVSPACAHRGEAMQARAACRHTWAPRRRSATAQRPSRQTAPWGAIPPWPGTTAVHMQGVRHGGMAHSRLLKLLRTCLPASKVCMVSVPGAASRRLSTAAPALLPSVGPLQPGAHRRMQVRLYSLP